LLGKRGEEQKTGHLEEEKNRWRGKAPVGDSRDRKKNGKKRCAGRETSDGEKRTGPFVLFTATIDASKNHILREQNDIGKRKGNPRRLI